MKKSIPVTVADAGKDKCDLCTGAICCTYITQQIPGPRSKHDFDHLLWQISHQNVHIYKDYEGWFLQVNNRCNHLHDDGRCGIYFDRPQICRDHSNDYCEYDAPARDGYDLFFDSYESLLGYCRKRFRHWDRDRSIGPD